MFNITKTEYIKQILMDMKGGLGYSIITLGGFNTPLQHWTDQQGLAYVLVAIQRIHS